MFYVITAKVKQNVEKSKLGINFSSATKTIDGWKQA